MSKENQSHRTSVADSENNNMKLFFTLAFFACLMTAALSQKKRVTEDNHCPLACARNYVPVCGMRQENGVWVENIFPNECEMQDENECHNGNYIPCPKKE